MKGPVLREVTLENPAVLDEVAEYDIPGLEFPTPPLVLDLGANIGAFAVWARHRWPGCAVVSYEPHPKTFEVLHRNLIGNQECVLVEGAVADYDGETTLHLGGGNCCHALEPWGEESFTPGPTVRVMDALHLEPCDVLKIDVEGAELAILRRYRHLESCTAVMVEWHRESERAEIVQLLERAGLVVHVDGRIIRALSAEAHARIGPFKEIARKRYHLFLAVLGWKLSPFHAQARERLIVEALEQGYGLTIRAEMGSGIDRGRNISLAVMREQCPEATHFMYIDSDIAFAAKDITNMMRSGHQVIGGAYPKKRVNWKTVAELVRSGVPDDKLAEMAQDFVTNVSDPKDIRGTVNLQTGARMLEVDQLGTGFLMIRREAIEAYIEHYRAEIEYSTNYGEFGRVHHTVFMAETDPCSVRGRARLALLEGALQGIELEELAADYRHACADPKTMGIYVTEDYAFCNRWRLMGGKVILYVDAKLAHQGPFLFEGHIGHFFPKEKDNAA